MKKSIIPEKAVFRAFNDYAKVISKTATETETENKKRAFDISIIHVESGRENEKRLETAIATIRAAVNTYKMYMSDDERKAYSNRLNMAINGYKDAARGVSGWIDFINMSDAEKLDLATAKARAAAVKQAEKSGKKTADCMQFSDDAAQAALMFMCFEMAEKSDRAPESILSYTAQKVIYDSMYRAFGRKDRETTIDDAESIDKQLYIGRAYIPAAEKTTIVRDTYNEILTELKPRDREKAARLLSMMKDGYSIEQAAEKLNVSTATGYNLFNRIASAAAIVKENDAESARIDFDIEKEAETVNNIVTMESWKAPKAPKALKAPKAAVTFKETEHAPVNFDADAARREHAFMYYCDAEKARAAYKRRAKKSDAAPVEKMTFEKWLIKYKGYSKERAADVARRAWIDDRIK